MDYETFGNWTLIIVGVLTILSGLGTVAGQLDQVLAEFNVAQFSLLFGILKLIGGLLLLIPLTRTIGGLFTISYFGGAIATHLAFRSFGGGFISLLVLMTALWAGYLARYFGETGRLV